MAMNSNITMIFVYTVRLWDLPTGLPRGALKGEFIGYPEIDFS
jgi:hypothetical protein